MKIIRKDIKNAYIRIKPTGEVTVTVPREMSDREIDRMLEKKAGWIEKKQLEAAPAHEPAYGEKVALWGRTYTLELGDMYVDNGNSVIYVPEPVDMGLLALRKKELKERCDELVPLWMERTGIHVNEWRIRNMSTRWGSCNPGKKRIWLSVMLTEYPVCCLEQTICHELAHIRIRGAR